MSQPNKLGAELAKLAMPSVENCTLVCCNPSERQRPFAELYAAWHARHGGPLLPEDERQTEDGLPWCDNCGGKRWLRRDVPPNDPQFGQLVRCQQCPADARAEQRQQLARHAGLAGEHMLKTFETFTRRRGTEDALAAAHQWAEHPDGWLVIHGTPNGRGERRLGQGKTHLACAVTNALLDRLVPVSWWYVPDLISEIQRAIATNESAAILERLKAMPILVLDDLGAARATEYAVGSVLEPLLNYRERNRLPTLITCIGDPKEIRDGLSNSIGRRMQDPTLCRVVALDVEQYLPVGARHLPAAHTDVPF